MGRPNCSRSLAYWSVVSKMARQVATVDSAIAVVASSQRPLDGRGRARVAGLEQHAVVGDLHAVEGHGGQRAAWGRSRRWPWLRTASPGTRNAPSPSPPAVPSARATTATSSAVAPSSTWAFAPSSTQPSAAGRAVVVTAAGRQSPCSARASVPVHEPSAIRGRTSVWPLSCSSGASCVSVARRGVGATTPPELLDDDAELEEAEAEPAVLLGDGECRPSRAPPAAARQLGRGAPRRRTRHGPRPAGRPTRAPSARRIAQLELLGRELEVHYAAVGRPRRPRGMIVTMASMAAPLVWKRSVNTLYGMRSTRARRTSASTSESPKPAPVEQADEPGDDVGGHVLGEAHDVVGLEDLHLLPGADHAAVALVGGEPLVEPHPELVRLAADREPVEQLDHPGAGLLGEHPEEVVLVLEVPVEAPVGDAGHLDDVVDAGVVVAAGGQHLGPGIEQELAGLLAPRAQAPVAIVGRRGQWRRGPPCRA